ncbi:MAG TPA: hypothetical protein VLT16_01365 [Candidatus Limnocylindrales bacterium]|nr:hypothetical protein [Candidatus Limnocylindrales bacterium]
MKKCCISFVAMLALSVLAAAQAGANGSATAGASVTPGQAGAGVNSTQNAQVGGASAGASANASGSAQASHHEKAKHEHGAKAGAASQGSGSAATNAGSAALNGGAGLQAVLTKSVDARKAKPGDEVTARLTQDFKSDGKVVYRKGSRLIGHVTEAQAHTKTQAESRLGVVFDKVQPKGGEEASIHAVIQALAPPAQGMLSSSADESAGMPAMGSMGGGGGSAGGMLGGVTGGATSTLGAAAGNAGNVAGGVTGGVASGLGSTASGATGTGLTAQGTLTSASQGVIGMRGLSLASATAGGAQGSVVSSATRTVKLESGTRMLLNISGAVK